jgi:cytidylate kinase
MIEWTLRQARFVVVGGLPGSKKTTTANLLKILPGWRVDSLGDHVRHLFKETGLEREGVRFDEWIMTIPIDEKLEAHYQFGEKNARGNVILDMRYPEVFEGEQGVLAVFVGGIRWSGLSRHGISRNQMVRIF